MTTLTWTGFASNGNPNDPKNWHPQEKPTINTPVVFPWGTINLDPGHSWVAASVTLMGGARVGFASLPYVSGEFTVESGAAAFITAASGSLDVTTLTVNGGSEFISALPVMAVSVSITAGSRFIAQNGLEVATSVTVWGGSHGKAYGSVVMGHEPGVQLGSSWDCDSQQNCYAAGTMILMDDGTEHSIETIRVGDKIHGGHAVNWVGHSSRKADFVKIGSLIVTDKHLIFQGDVLYQARVIPGAVPVNYTGPYYHIQCSRHVPVIANGIVSESFLDTDGYTDLETLSGERLPRRFSRSDAFATIVEV